MISEMQKVLAQGDLNKGQEKIVNYMVGQLKKQEAAIAATPQNTAD